VFFITGRFEHEYNHEKPSEWTLRNLKAAGYTDVAADHLYMRGITADSGVSDYKTSKRIDIVKRSLARWLAACVSRAAMANARLKFMVTQTSNLSLS
jgi:hypothetical protein